MGFPDESKVSRFHGIRLRGVLPTSECSDEPRSLLLAHMKINTKTLISAQSKLRHHVRKLFISHILSHS